MTAMTADYQRGYRAGLKAAKGETIRDKEARAAMAALVHRGISRGWNAAETASDAYAYADAMEAERNKKITLRLHGQRHT